MQRMIRQAAEIDGGDFRQTLIERRRQEVGGRLWQAAVDGHPETPQAGLGLCVARSGGAPAPDRRFAPCEGYLAFVMAELRLSAGRRRYPGSRSSARTAAQRSAVVKEMVQRFAACRYARVEVCQRRLRLIARAHDSAADDEPGGQFFVLAAGLAGGLLDSIGASQGKGYILACDATYLDLVVDDQRHRDGAQRRLARTLWRLLPKPDLVFLLDSEPDVLSRRQQEVLLS